MASVRLIPAVARNADGSAIPLSDTIKRKTAGYARVSTDSDEQETSYDAQVKYFTNYIKQNADWEFVQVYTDDGRSGLMTKKRNGFNDMVSDALDGKIDLIITKSVSRFARNTVDTLSTVRKLKEKGVEIWFEKENIHTLDSKGEILITIMSSLAQDESRSISENVTWGLRKRMADGKFSLGYKRFLGYDKGEDGMPVINELEAEIVRLIYSLFLEGQTPNGIANHLTSLRIPTPAGKVKWSVSTVQSILSNEKYKGCALLQKTYVVDFLTKKSKVNEGELPSYYVEGSHPAIIAPEVFEMVQLELKRRKALGGYSGANMFAAKLVCGDCGGYFGAKTWHSTDAHKRTIYQCNSKYSKDKLKCATPHLSEDEIKARFVTAINHILTERDELLAAFREIKSEVFDTSALDTEFDDLKTELAVVAELVQKCVNENAHKKLDQDKYRACYDALTSRYEAANSRLSEIAELRSNKKLRERQVGRFLVDLQSQPSLVTAYDEQLWHSLLDHATVQSDGAVAFTFRDGSSVVV